MGGDGGSQRLLCLNPTTVMVVLLLGLWLLLGCDKSLWASEKSYHYGYVLPPPLHPPLLLILPLTPLHFPPLSLIPHHLHYQGGSQCQPMKVVNKVMKRSEKGLEANE